VDGCIQFQDLYLLYVGISPRQPSKSGKNNSQNLKARIFNHFTGNAEGSTLRLSLGCLLSDKLKSDETLGCKTAEERQFTLRSVQRGDFTENQRVGSCFMHLADPAIHPRHPARNGWNP
jgi:hypothetical protein